MTKDELIKNQFPNDEFLQSAVLQIVDKCVAELEKENTELKEELKAKQVVLNDFKSRVETVTDRFNKKSSQLTKAKELLEDLIRFQPYIDKETIFLSIGNEWKTVIYKAEQFLKEVSE